MGRASRRKRDRLQGNAKLFEQAMADVELEDRAALIGAFNVLARKVTGEAVWHSAENLSIAVTECLFSPSPWPCQGCGAAARTFACWRPSRRCLTGELGLGRRDTACLFYPVCSTCARRCESGDRVHIAALEDRIIGEIRSSRTIRIDLDG